MCAKCKELIEVIVKMKKKKSGRGGGGLGRGPIRGWELVRGWQGWR